MASKIERKYTIVSNASQSPSTGTRGNLSSLRRQESKIVTSVNKLADRVGTLGMEQVFNRIEKAKDLTRVNIKSPKFDMARQKLGMSEQEVLIKNRRVFEYDDKGNISYTIIFI
jgi:hypothetical protein